MRFRLIGEKPDLKLHLRLITADFATQHLCVGTSRETVAAERSNEVLLRIGEALIVSLCYFDNQGEILSALTTELSFVEIQWWRT